MSKKVKVLYKEITKCWDCPHEQYDTANECDYCELTDSTIEDEDTIQPDCPLPDKEP